MHTIPDILFVPINRTTTRYGRQNGLSFLNVSINTRSGDVAQLVEHWVKNKQKTKCNNHAASISHAPPAHPPHPPKSTLRADSPCLYTTATMRNGMDQHLRASSKKNPSTGCHIPLSGPQKILHTLVGMGSTAALLAAVVVD